MDRRFSRRRVVLGLTSGLTGISMGAGQTGAFQPGPVFGGFGTPELESETGLAGIQLFRDWVAGRVPKIQVPPDWARMLPPQGAGFFAPRDWSMIPVSDPNLADLSDGNPFGAWIISPDLQAGVLMVNITSLVRVALVEAAWRDIRALYPETPIERITEDALGVDQYGVDRAVISGRMGEKTLALVASSIPDTVLGGMYIYYNLAIASTSDFDDLTTKVFLPILMNIVPAGGASSEKATPTPTPTI